MRILAAVLLSIVLLALEGKCYSHVFMVLTKWRHRGGGEEEAVIVTSSNPALVEPVV